MTLKSLQNDINQLYDHAKVANQEMGVIREDIAVIKTDLVWVKTQLDMIDAKVWWVLSTVIVGSLLSVAINFLKLK